MSEDEFDQHMESCVEPSSPELKKDFKTFCERCSYITLDKNAGDDSFVELNERMETFIEADEAQNRHFYMALPPNIYTAVSEQLRRNCYSDKGDCQIIVCVNNHTQSERQLLLIPCLSDREAIW